MEKLPGYLFALSILTCLFWLIEWALIAFVAWDLQWLSDMAEWDGIFRFMFLLGFGVPAGVIAALGADVTWGDQ